MVGEFISDLVRWRFQPRLYAGDNAQTLCRDKSDLSSLSRTHRGFSASVTRLHIKEYKALFLLCMTAFEVRFFKKSIKFCRF